MYARFYCILNIVNKVKELFAHVDTSCSICMAFTDSVMRIQAQFNTQLLQYVNIIISHIGFSSWYNLPLIYFLIYTVFGHLKKKLHITCGQFILVFLHFYIEMPLLYSVSICCCNSQASPQCNSYSHFVISCKFHSSSFSDFYHMNLNEKLPPIDESLPSRPAFHLISDPAH